MLKRTRRLDADHVPKKDAWASLFALSIVLALASPILLRISPVISLVTPVSEIYGVFIVFGPPTAWAIIVIVCIVRYGARGLWLLIGAPFALFWFYFRV
jgi:hypothetical protein